MHVASSCLPSSNLSIYIDMCDDIVQNCEVQVEVIKELFDKVDHWDSRKINEIVNR